MTEQTMNQAIEKLAENYNQLEQSLVNQLRLQVPNHQLTVGTYRERVWKSLFEMIIPKKYCIEQSVFIIDSYGNISREVDLAVYDEMYTPYIFNYGEIKFIPIEAVVVVVQCKSKIESKAEEKEPPVDENGKTRETMAQNLEKWAKSITNLKTSLDSVTRTITDLVDNYDENLLKDEHNKNLTQTSSRPIRILCATKIHQSMMETLKENFDILLYVEDIKATDKKESFSKLTKVIRDESLNFVGWNNHLNHWGHERYAEQMEQVAYQDYMKERQQKQLRSPASLKSRNLTQLRVTNHQEEENTILSLTFQLNQLLMFLNNPMLFPHRAYARMFTKNLGGKIQED